MRKPVGRNVEFEGRMIPVLSSWAFAIAYCAFSFGMFWMGLVHVRHFVFILITGFFAAFGPVYLFVTMRATLDARRFGAMRLRANSPMATVGGRLSATLRVSDVEAVRGHVRAELRCNHLSFDEKRNRSEETVWAEEKRFPIQRDARGSYALLAFDIPDGLPPNDTPAVGGIEPGRKYGRWELQAVAESHGAYRDELYAVVVRPPLPGQPPSKAVWVPPARPAARPAPPEIVRPLAAPPKPARPAREVLPEIPPGALQEETRAVAEPPEAATTWILVAANLVPIAGVAFWGWRVQEVVFLYWVENLVIGAFNILRIAAAEPVLAPEHEGKSLFAAKLALIGFFVMHYGAFCYGHGEALAALFGRGADGQSATVGGMLLAVLREPAGFASVLAIIVSHGVSYYRNYIGRGEYEGAEIGEMMGRPYKRIFVTHIFVIAGGFLLMAAKSPVLAILAFIGIKIGFDVFFHRREHDHRAKASPSG